MLLNYHFDQYLPRPNHDHPYVEIFFGSGIVYFKIAHRGIFAFLNDIDDNLINFWKVVKFRHTELTDALRFTWCAEDNRKWFDNWTNDPVQRAALFYLNNRHTQYITKPSQIEDDFTWWNTKLNGDRIFLDCRDFEQEMDYTMGLYTQNMSNRPCSCIYYGDPPYYGMEEVYKKYKKNDLGDHPKPFNHELYAQKCAEARDQKHFVLNSYNDCPEVRELYKGWFIKECPYSPNGVGEGRATPRVELLISSHAFKTRSGQKTIEACL